ncbi:cytochrome c biogenesis CcdA family protein [Maritimibacter fusiformis]|uniref:Cytochrome c biogenesis protein CcdA n=1 Tax=Maritimibacter fusiformis TaxID=2603819 RepID=A0A5D0RAR8_9RHOB|nr:cytochrome c biogenesis protein CcdA [Maritimibacter fusiformis]TYB77798.1 cytochrome c biogenesis protein CcdA [Maritimibacter fusiformis]
MELILAYAAGLLTLINPCVLPVLPIVLATALQASRLGPVALAAGMSLSFVVLGMLVTTFGHAIGLTEDVVSRAGAVLMLGFGVVLLVPRFNAAFATATAGFAARADAGLDGVDRSGLPGQFLGGLLLGAVWSPCIGPTLGGAISLASQGGSLAWAGAIMVAFALGVSTLILAIGYGLRATALRRMAGIARPVLGVAFILVGLAILFRLHHVAEAWAVQNLPAWLIDLSVSI